MLGIGKRKPNKDGINLMAAILLCYPEVDTVSLEPEKKSMNFVFRLKSMPPQELLDKTCTLVNESIETYHKLSGIDCRERVKLYTEEDEVLTLLHVERDFRSVSRGEISMLAELLREGLGGLLLVEEDGGRDEMSDARERAIDQMLDTLRGIRIVEHIIGMREAGKVVVFHK